MVCHNYDVGVKSSSDKLVKIAKRFGYHPINVGDQTEVNTIEEVVANDHAGWVGIPGLYDRVSPGWVYRPYLNCVTRSIEGEGGKTENVETCSVQDPTGTPLVIHNGPRGPNVGTILNGTPVVIVAQVGSYVQIAIDKDACSIAQDVNGAIYCQQQHSAKPASAGDGIGWVKSADIQCEENNECTPKDNYTDAHKKGDLCATFGIPVYIRPDGMPIAELWNEVQVICGEQRDGYTFVSFPPNVHANDDPSPLMPYDAKNLRVCG